MPFEAARENLLRLGGKIGEVIHGGDDVYAGPDEPYFFGRIRVKGRDPEQRSFASFSDHSGEIMSTSTTTVPFRREPELLGQTVVVIGGSAGIGLEIARRARSEGARLILTARNPERLEVAAGELEPIRTAAFDANDPAAIEQFFGDLPGTIDHVMVTAGQPHYGRLLDVVGIASWRWTRQPPQSASRDASHSACRHSSRRRRACCTHHDQHGPYRRDLRYRRRTAAGCRLAENGNMIAILGDAVREQCLCAQADDRSLTVSERRRTASPFGKAVRFRWID